MGGTCAKGQAGSHKLTSRLQFPGTGQGRYRDTRAFISKLGNLGSLGMQYHIAHHLYPTIPLHRTPAAYRALRPILAERGCDLGGL